MHACDFTDHLPGIPGLAGCLPYFHSAVVSSLYRIRQV